MVIICLSAFHIYKKPWRCFEVEQEDLAIYQIIDLLLQNKKAV